MLRACLPPKPKPEMKPTILICIGAFWPGNESSGPNLSIRAQCEALGDEFDFRIVARDRPFEGGPPLAPAGEWQDRGHAKAACLPVGRLGARGLSTLLAQTPHDLLVLNGFFDREFTIPALVARRTGQIASRPVLLSPRGEFTSGALSLKATPKRLFRAFARATGLHDGVALHVTSEAELADVRHAMPGNDVTLVPNFRPLFPAPDYDPRRHGEPLRLAFLGRISPVKGLDIALKAMSAAATPAHLDIYGPIGDAAHWQDCEQLIADLPDRCSANWHGEIANADAPAMLAAHDALLLPSLSENFGHAIFESLATGTPVIIGDRTPWRGIEAGKAGIEARAGDVASFAKALATFAKFDQETQSLWRKGARAHAEHFSSTNGAGEDMAKLFNRLIAKGTA
jgi:glycosyltransferase involved in cell wall biosynthesis